MVACASKTIYDRSLSLLPSTPPTEKLFSGRQITRAVSEKPSTVRNREREARRVGRSAAIMKIKGKWRKRIFKAKEQLRASEEYRQMSSDVRGMALCDLVAEHKMQRDCEIEAMEKLYLEYIAKHDSI
jgi:hypothetical protein